jgi:hypothetical protein
MIHGIPIVSRCPACGNGILIKQAGRNECGFEGCSREATVYMTQEEINAALVPALVKEIEGYKKALISARTREFKLPFLQVIPNGWRTVPQSS